MFIYDTIKRLLSLKLTREEILEFNDAHLNVGLVATWLVGIGRYWDDKGASLPQHLGIGSLIYVLVLAGIIWTIVKPFKVKDWTYFRVLTFISLTSFPAILYAIPVELFCDRDTANTINVWFLAIVAIWRVSMLWHFMKVFTKINPFTLFVVNLLPICLIIASLTVLNLHRAVFAVMGGLEGEPTAHDTSFLILNILTSLSMLLSLPLVLAYIILVLKVKPQN
jgi:hypothetical protein